MGDYPDPDQYYTAVARQPGIPKLAYDAVQEKYG